MINISGSIRRVLFSTAFTASALLMSSGASAALPVTPTAVGQTTQIGEVTVRNVAFPSNGITLSGNVYLPKGFNPQRKYAAIVVVHPGGGVKEQTAGLYALKMAEAGFVTLAFDAAHQGASGGLPRFIDDPMERVGEFYNAVDYLTSQVVNSNPAIDAAFCNALRVTLVGSTTPALTRSS